MNTNDISKNTIVLGAIIGLSIVVGVIIASGSFLHARSYDDALSVTGSAKQLVTSDRVKLSGTFTRTVTMTELQGGYAKMATDLIATKAFFTENGVLESELLISPVYTEQVYKQDDSAQKEFTLRQTVEVNSANVDIITTLSKNTQALISKGVFFQTQNLEYSYSKLADIRVSLLSDALTDARARAEEIASSGGKKVGDLKSAASGVVQVLSPNSNDISDYGTYNTQSIEKEIMVTVKASFGLK